MAHQRIVLVRASMTGLAACAILLVASRFSSGSGSDDHDNYWGAEALVHENAHRMIAEGKHTFRYDTFGDEAFWGGTLKLHQAIAGAKQDGVGPGVSPATALAVGLKVDVDALPDSLRSKLAHGAVDLNSPATTLALLKLNAVVGVTGFSIKLGASRPWAFNARCAIRPLIIPSLRESDTVWTAGRIEI